MTRILAFDQSSAKSGWTFGSTATPLGEWISGRFRAPKRDEIGERMNIIYDAALDLIDIHGPDIVVIERPFDPSWQEATAAAKGEEYRQQFSRATMNLLQMVRGAILMAAARRSVPTEDYPTQSWQATLKLPYPPADIPKAKRSLWKKEEVRRIVTRMGAKVETLDESDSWGLCFHALHGKAGIKRATEDLFARARSGL
jgi:Holliday junction resolvasome RuvABC endonuclease subunit